MKNKFITKIIGATLAFAMMIGGAVGVNAAKQAKEVNADSGTYTIGWGAAGTNQTFDATTGTVTFAEGHTASFSTAKNSSGSNPAYNSNNKQLRLYYASNGSGGSITFTCSNVTITGFVVNSATSPTLKYSVNGGAATSVSATSNTYTVTGISASSSLTLQNGNTTNTQLQISKIQFSYYYDGNVVPTYSVTYEDGGATSGTVPVDDGEYESGEHATVLGNTGDLAKEDYVFGGWTDGEDEYAAGDQIEITGNTTLTAIWNVEPGLDILDRGFTGVASGGGYGSWSGKTGQAGSVYAGNTAGGNDSIQLRASDNSGIVSTTSAGNVRKVTVAWDSHTQSGRTINIYGKNTAYSSAADLYSNNNKGDLLGTIVCGTSTFLTITDDYRYVGICSAGNALYLSKVKINWEEVQLNPRVEFSPASLTLKTNQTNGATITALVEDVATPTYSWVANDANITLENANAATVTVKPNTNVAANSSVTLTVGGTNPNLVETVQVTIEIPEPGETAGTAYTVAQAKAAIASAENDIEGVYVTGIISKVDSVNLSTHKATYWISDDGTTANQFKIYNGKYVDNADFTSGDQVIPGDEVIVFGTISKEYTSLNDSKIISIDLAPRVTSVVLTPAAVTVDLGSDGNIVDLFTNINISQEAGSNKTANDITWTSEDEDVFAVINGKQYIAGDTHRTSTTIHAFLNNKEFASATVNVFDSNAHVITYNLPEEWRRVTDPSTLAAGDQVILTGVKSDVRYAAGTFVTDGNNIQADTEHLLTESGNTVTGVVDTMIYTLEAGTVEGSLAFKDHNGDYLYAASSSKNYLRASSTKNANSSFILNANGTVAAQGSNTRNCMRYNNEGESNLFSCYSSGGTTGTIVTFYKLSTGTAELDLFNLSAIRTAHEDENSAYIRLGVSLSEEDWAAMDSAFGIAGYGVMLIRETTLEVTTFDTIAELYNSNDSENKAKLSNRGKDSDAAPQDFSVAAKISISNDSDRAVVFCAATYVKASDGTIYFINETRGSLVGLL